ncbi:MAG: hypothetical protein LBJ31_00990 [Treponema sp.]|jgi:hypothetical protein|nr:hypothetical protein [Treponema sp.]
MPKSKKLPFFALLGFLALGAAPVQAQQPIPPQDLSDLYYVTVPIEKVYPYRKGYVVVYRRGANRVAQAYIPFEWFRANVKKADLIQIGYGSTQPCLSVFYKEGKFHYVRLYVSRQKSHATWGLIPSIINIDDRFEGLEELQMAYD